MNKLPIYRIVLENEEQGVYAVSLVDKPAIEVDWIKLSEEIVLEFKADSDKQLLQGPLLIPEKLIYRRDNNGNEFFITFDKETIALIAERYNKSKINDVFNFMHSDKTVEAFLTENWITGKTDKSQDFGFNLPEGTWFGSVKVEDKNFWMSEVRTDKVKGFSIEIRCGVELIKLSEMKEIDTPDENSEDKNNIIKLMTIKTKDGSEFEIEALEVGKEVFIVDPEGNKVAVNDGDYELEDGTIIKVVAGRINEVSAKEEEAADIEQEMADNPVPGQDENVDNTEYASKSDLDELRVIIGELVNKIAELESSISNANETTNAQLSKIEELETKLSMTPGATSIDLKNDEIKLKKEAKERDVLERISNIKKLQK